MKKNYFITLLASVFVITFFENCKKNDTMDSDTQPVTENPAPPAENLEATTSSDISAITWGTAKSLPIATHEYHGEVVNGKLYVFGGYDVNKRPEEWSPTKRAFVFNPTSNTWASIADLPQTPTGPGYGGITHVGLTTDGKDIYFAGGYTSTADGDGQVFGTRQVWKYTVTTNSYSQLPDLPQPLAAGQLQYLNGRLHYMGGANLSRADVGVHYALSLSNLSAGWKSLAPLLNPVNHPGSAVYDGKIYFVGGSHNQNDNSVTQKTLEVYNDNTNTWTKLADMPLARDHIASAVVVLNDQIIVLGGETSHNVLSDHVSAYSPATNSWDDLTPLPVGKSAGVAAALNGILYYVGGNFSTVNYKGTPVSSSPRQTTLAAVADSYVANGVYASNNFGKSTSLLIKGSTVSNYLRNAYLNFSLTGITSVVSAKLRLYGYNSENSTSISVSCYGVNNDSWTENGITFNNAPTNITGTLNTANVNNQRKYIEFDVTSFVKSQFSGDKKVSFVLKDAGYKSANLIFNSRENSANKPQLVISY